MFSNVQYFINIFFSIYSPFTDKGKGHGGKGKGNEGDNGKGKAKVNILKYLKMIKNF